MSRNPKENQHDGNHTKRKSNSPKQTRKSWYSATREICGLAIAEGAQVMIANVDQPKTPDSKPGSKPDAKDDLKTLPMPEVEKNWDRRRTASLKPRRRNG